MDFSIENLRIKTFPIEVEFDWLTWEGEKFENEEVQFIKEYIIIQRGTGAILNNSLYKITTYNKLSKWREYLKFFRRLSNCKISFSLKNLLIIDIWSSGPYHFYVDILSKLIYLKEKQNFSFSKWNLILSDDQFTREVVLPIIASLGFNFKNLKLLSRSQSHIIIGDSMYVTKPHIAGSCNPYLIKNINELIRSNFPRETNIGPNKVYYFRKNRKRLVINDEEVMVELAKRGFYCTDFDNLSYLKSWYLMKDVKLFMGIHGGGLTNMIFMKKGGHIIEFKTKNPNPQSHCYWSLAYALNHDYTMFVSDYEGESWIIEGTDGCDIRVNINALTRLLDDLGNN